MQTRIVTAGLLFQLLACSADRTLGLSGTHADDVAGDARRRRMNINVSLSAINGPTSEDEIGVRWLTREYILSDCVALLRDDPGGYPFNHTDCAGPAMVEQEPDLPGASSEPPAFEPITLCVQAACRPQIAICAANRLLELAKSPVPVTFSMTESPPGSVTVPPQDSESKVWYAEEAFYYAAWAAQISAQTLLRATGHEAPEWCSATQLAETEITVGPAPGTQIPYGELFASSIGDASLLANEAARAAVEYHKAVADADPARTPDIRLASKFRWIDGTMSRARGAHILTGGARESGLAGFTEGMFPLAPLSNDATRALRVLRLSGAKIAALTNLDFTFDNLFRGEGTNDTSLKDRLHEATGDPTLAGNLASTQFLERQGLTEEHFTDARLYLSYETKAFSRDTNSLFQLPQHPVASSRDGNGNLVEEMSQIPMYAIPSVPATRPPPAVHLRVMARNADASGKSAAVAIPLINVGVPTSEGEGVPVGWTNALNSLDDFNDAVTAAVSALLGDHTIVAPWLEPLAEQPPLVEGRVEACYRYYDSGSGFVDEVRLRVYGTDAAAADIDIVEGLPNLQCALDGTVDGGECDLTTLGTVISRTDKDDGEVGYRNYAQLVIHVADALPQEWVYVIEKPAGTPSIKGNYSALAGFLLVFDHIADEDYRYCTLYPISDAIDDDVTDVLGPDPDSLADAQVSCAGPWQNTPIPLENELSSDGDAYESSWRVYLDRAKAAADRADALAENLIEAGLELDKRVESAEEDLERLCGGPISLSPFYPSAENPAFGDSCAELDDGDACVTAGAVCRNGRCVKDPLAAIEAAAADNDTVASQLANCLGDDGYYDFVTLGSDLLCLWKDSDGSICSGSDPATHPCPYQPDDSLCDDSPPAPPMVTRTDVLVDVHLNLIPPADESGPMGEELPTCATVRRLRKHSVINPERLALVNELHSSFALEDVAAVAAAVGWEPRAADYSAVIFNNRELFTTGDPYDLASPEATSWPCTGPYEGRQDPEPDASDCTATGDESLWPSLFCSYAPSCAFGNASETKRIRMNHRLGRAVLALRILTGVGVGPLFKGPYRKGEALQEWESLDGDDPIVGISAGGIPEARVTKTTSRVDYVGNLGVGLWHVEGKAICVDGADDSTIWSDLGDLDTAPVAFDVVCDSNPTVIFRLYNDQLVPESNGNAHDVWADLDGDSTASGTGPFYRKMRSLLETPPADEDIINISDDAAAQLSSYWQFAAFPGPDETALNDIPLARDGLRARDILDALELACELRRVAASGFGECPPEPDLSDNVLADLTISEEYLKCKARELEQMASRQVLADVPVAAVSGVDGTAQFAGELGSASAEFAAAVMHMRDAHRNITFALENFASDMSKLRGALRGTETAEQLQAIQTASAIANQTAACASGIGNVLGREGLAAAGAAIGAIATCGNASVQIGLALEAQALNDDLINLQGQMSWEDFKQLFRGHADTIMDNVDAFAEQVTLLQGALARMATARTSGQRALAKAMVLGADAAGRQFHVNTVMRRRYNTVQVRYERACSDAVAAAWLARRAVEQRLGLDLSEMYDDLSLVDAPARWADTLCTSSCADYGRIRSEAGLDVDDFADAYVGDYVRKLELVVDSYQFDFPFTDASDTAVISLRDDVLATRANCVTSVPNLLAYSSYLYVGTDAEGLAVWQKVGCEEVGGVITNCVRAKELSGVDLDDIPIPYSVSPSSGAPPYSIIFSGPGVTSFTASTALVQTVSLAPGYYRISWYGAEPSPGEHDPLLAVDVRQAGVTYPSTPPEPGPPPDGYGWRRYHRLFYAAEPGDYDIAIVPQADNFDEHKVGLAGLMLEDVTGAILGAPDISDVIANAYPPGAYVSTVAAGTGTGLLCEDTSGAVFRGLARRGCAALCPTGFGTCGDGASVHCFWEFPFHISIDGIESGGILNESGFAYGNYNYRLDTLAVNFVGTSLRDCSASPSPSTCFGSGTIPFSILHLKPYVVRNHLGELYEAPLFTGRIEHGRGLAAERYLTNPLSSADASLLQNYWHGELRGRPITGNYVLKIWDTDGVSMRNLEDVQLILKYRYWTRFQ